jgi:hypothetical protein
MRGLFFLAITLFIAHNVILPSSVLAQNSENRAGEVVFVPSVSSGDFVGHPPELPIQKGHYQTGVTADGKPAQIHLSEPQLHELQQGMFQIQRTGKRAKGKIIIRHKINTTEDTLSPPTRQQITPITKSKHTKKRTALNPISNRIGK